VASTGELSAFKFNAAWRRDAYKRKDVTEQKSMLTRIERGDEFRQKELMDVLEAVVAQHFTASLMPSGETNAGGAAQRYRIFKGVEKPYGPDALREIGEPVRFDLADIHAPFEWRELESSEEFGTYRWSGPLTSSTVDLPVKADQGLSVTVHVLKARAIGSIRGSPSPQRP
jgi:hypothetical protein